MNGMYISKTPDHYRPTPKKTMEPDTNAKDVEKADPQFKKYLSSNPTMKNIVERPGFKKGTFGTKAKHKLGAKVERKEPVLEPTAPESRENRNHTAARVMPAPTGIAFHAKKR